MIPWLDHKLFGNGHGLASPYFDDTFYWLSGDLYHWIGGHGAQLSSFQWAHPRPGERRRLCGREFVVFSSSRSGRLPLRVSVSWAMTRMPQDINAANAEIARLKADLMRPDYLRQVRTAA